MKSRGSVKWKKWTAADKRRLTLSRKKWATAKKKCEDLRRLEDKAYKKILPDLRKEWKRAKRSGNVGVWNDFFPDGLRDTEIHLVESAGQHLDFRVGPVFGKKGVLKQPGIWIGYQRRHMASGRQGELLISPNTWRRLVKEIECRLKKYRASHYQPRK
jgi:hypothetical protein